MRRFVVAVGMLVGCAEGDYLHADGSSPGRGHGDGAAGTTGAAGSGGGEGGAADAGGAPVVRVCDAAVETLSGRAVHVPGSTAAVDPAAVNPFTPSQTCADWARANDAAYVAEVNVRSGTISGRALSLVGADPTGEACAYTLRTPPTPIAQSWPCSTTTDYLLTVP